MAKSVSARSLYKWLCIPTFGLILSLSLFNSIIPTAPAAASEEPVKWMKVNIPTEGKAGNWVLADGSDVQHLTIASDGTFYAYGQGLTYTLYKSTIEARVGLTSAMCRTT